MGLKGKGRKREQKNRRKSIWRKRKIRGEGRLEEGRGKRRRTNREIRREEYRKRIGKRKIDQKRSIRYNIIIVYV